VFGDSRFVVLAHGPGGWGRRRQAGSRGGDADVVDAAFTPGAVLVRHTTNLDSRRRSCGRDTASKSWRGESEDRESGVEDHFDWFDFGSGIFNFKKYASVERGLGVQGVARVRIKN